MQATPWRSIHVPCSSTALRATASCSARASELSNLAPRLRPARRTVAGRCPPRHLRDMCELVCMGLGASWAHSYSRPGTAAYIHKRYKRKKEEVEERKACVWEKESIKSRRIQKLVTQDMSSPCDLCRCGRLFTLYEPDSQPARHAQQTAVYHLKYFKSTPPA